MKALRDSLPTREELAGIQAYMKRGENDETEREQLYAGFSDCEKYMYCIKDVPHAAEKFDCLIFRSTFQARFDELMASIRLVESACDEVHTSERLRQIMAMILTVVNQINTGGDEKGAAGFSLDALLKLNEVGVVRYQLVSKAIPRRKQANFFSPCVFFVQAKAFDKKTSVLQYFVKLVKRNDVDLLKVSNDLSHINEAQMIIMDSLYGDMKELQEEIEMVHETASRQAEQLEKKGAGRRMSLQDFREQRSTVRSVENVPQYNQINHLTGRTSMERFTLHAQASVEEAMTLTEGVKDKFKKLLEYFGEDEKMASNDFFVTMQRFLVEFQKAKEQVDKEEKQRVRIVRVFPVTVDFSNSIGYSDNAAKRGKKARGQT